MTKLGYDIDFKRCAVRFLLTTLEQVARSVPKTAWVLHYNNGLGERVQLAIRDTKARHLITRRRRLSRTKTMQETLYT